MSYEREWDVTGTATGGTTSYRAPHGTDAPPNGQQPAPILGPGPYALYRNAPYASPMRSSTAAGRIDPMTGRTTGAR